MFYIIKPINIMCVVLFYLFITVYVLLHYRLNTFFHPRLINKNRLFWSIIGLITAIETGIEIIVSDNKNGIITNLRPNHDKIK